MFKVALSLLVVVLLTSCGGGGASNSISTFESPTYSATYTTAQLPTLYYEASPSGLTGTFTTNERFNFKSGDVVTFYISESNKFLVAKSPALPTSFTDLNTNNAELEKPLLSAYYIDAPVKGLVYENSVSGLNGVTDELGRFRFFSGDEVRYYLDSVNKILLGKVSPVDGQKIFIRAELEEDIFTAWIPYLLYGLDEAPAGSSYMDVSKLSLSQEVAQSVKDLFALKSLPSFGAVGNWSVWSAVSGIRKSNANVTYKVPDRDLNSTKLNVHLSNSLKSFPSMPIGDEFVNSLYLMDFGGLGFYYFDGNQTVRYIVDRTQPKEDSFEISQGEVIYFDTSNVFPDRKCDFSLNAKHKAATTTYMSFQDLGKPVGCIPYSVNQGVANLSKLSSEIVDVGYFKNLKITISKKNICGFGEGDVQLNFGELLSATKVAVSMSGELCNEKIGGVGTLEKMDLPGLFNLTLPMKGSGPTLYGNSQANYVFVFSLDFKYIALSRYYFATADLSKIYISSFRYSTYKFD